MQVYVFGWLEKFLIQTLDLKIFYVLSLYKALGNDAYPKL